MSVPAPTFYQVSIRPTSRRDVTDEEVLGDGFGWCLRSSVAGVGGSIDCRGWGGWAVDALSFQGEEEANRQCQKDRSICRKEIQDQKQVMRIKWSAERLSVLGGLRSSHDSRGVESFDVLINVLITIPSAAFYVLLSYLKYLVSNKSIFT